LGAHGERVEDPADLAAAIERGLENAPAVVDVVTSQDAVSSDAHEGAGLRARLPGADRLGRCRAQAPRRNLMQG
jgi:hypothetical protein